MELYLLVWMVCIVDSRLIGSSSNRLRLNQEKIRKWKYFCYNKLIYFNQEHAILYQYSWFIFQWAHYILEMDKQSISAICAQKWQPLPPLPPHPDGFISVTISSLFVPYWWKMVGKIITLSLVQTRKWLVCCITDIQYYNLIENLKYCMRLSKFPALINNCYFYL